MGARKIAASYHKLNGIKILGNKKLDFQEMDLEILVAELYL